MAGASLLTLLDDIASVLDDVAALTKIAARKSAGVLGDDLALNAEQVSGVKADRELPVVWAVFKGSCLNKLILVPAALAISALAPWLVTPLLMAGGLFLCFEGFEKLFHSWQHRAENPRAKEMSARAIPADTMSSNSIPADAMPANGAAGSIDPLAFEREKIKGAVRTDFILSAEIIAITLGTVAAAALLTQVVVLAGIAAIMTIGVYGIVAGIVKLDDAGLYLSMRSGDGVMAQVLRKAGFAILAAAPYLMKILSVVGTAAMFLVGGGILAHGIHALQLGIDAIAGAAGAIAGVGGLLKVVTPMLLNAGIGLVAGAVALLIVTIGRRTYGAMAGTKSPPTAPPGALH